MGRRAWLALFASIIALDFIAPYTVLKEVPSLAGSYTFWSILALATVVLGIIYMGRWR